MSNLTCPICSAVSEGGHHVGDTTVIICPHCGGYKLAGTVFTLLEGGTLKKPEPQMFKALVRRKRGDSTEYPTITSTDLDG